jgi:glycosyltransferase involved in cell wall biosynthesis
MLNQNKPLCPEVGVLALPYHQFGSNWMTPHHLLTRLANYFHVVWLEPPTYWRHKSRWRQRHEELEALCQNLPSGFHIEQPPRWLPDIYKPPALYYALERARIRRGWDALGRFTGGAKVLYMWHPRFEQALKISHHDLSLYHIDDEYSFLPDPPPSDPQEERVIRAVDHVIVHSPLLMERKGRINPHTIFVPEGVDYGLYSTPVSEPPDIAAIPRPRIGYSGHLKKQLDWPLLKELAIRHSGWSFVFIGPSKLTGEDQIILSTMSQMKNVYLLGEKTVTELASYPQHFDVCLMPYIINGYTQNIYPLKLHEYLASGKPIVGKPIRSLLDFGHVIALATTPDEWSAALVKSLTAPLVSRNAVAARQAVARQYDWSELTYRIAETISNGLGKRFQVPVKKIHVDTPKFPQASLSSASV